MMEGYGLYFVALTILGFAASFMVSWLTPLRGLAAGAFGIGLVLVVMIAWIQFIELAILGAVIAALPSLAGASLGAMISRHRGN